LKVAAEAGKHITLEGQEKDVTTAGLARMNMILHDFPTANILSGNTLADPKFKDGEQLRTYDYVVANQPFSDKTWSTGLVLGEGGSGDKYQRFTWGVPPKKQGDYAYLLHIIRSMKSTGKGACILPHGVLFRGNAEAVIREKLVRSGYLKAIIGLPANLFYGTGIPACILVLDKENATARKGIFMIDASKGFKKDGPKNRLREQDIHKIVDTFTRQDESDPRYARMVPVRKSPTRRTITISTSRGTSTAPSRRICRTSKPTCAAASRSATSMRSATTGKSCPACAPPCSRN
jgi:type I restriction enzyme M protein